MAMTGHRTRAMFDRYSTVSTKDIEAALRKSDAAIGKPGRRKKKPIVDCSQRSGQKTEAPQDIEILGAGGCGG